METPRNEANPDEVHLMEMNEEENVSVEKNFNSNEITAFTRRKAQITMGSLALVNILVWVVTLLVSTKYPVLLSPAVLAYTFGLRHAVDADHIAAIDNVTRALMAHGKQPVTVGLFFSLGHSTVVFILTIIVIVWAQFLDNDMETSESVGGVIGTCVSAAFLLIIGIINGFVFFDLRKKWKQLRAKQSSKRGQIETEQDANEASDEEYLKPGGCCTRCFAKVFKVVDRPWKMYPLGFLFGLGFDTASEIALLGVSAITSQKGVPAGICLLLPIIFASGMSFIDTLDGILMLWTYGWAFLNPSKKLFYNMFLTGTSAFVAIFIGLVETGGILSEKLGWKGGFWDVISSINDNFEILGFTIVGIFITAFIASYLLYTFYFKTFDELEASPRADYVAHEEFDNTITTY